MFAGKTPSIIVVTYRDEVAAAEALQFNLYLAHFQHEERTRNTNHQLEFHFKELLCSQGRYPPSGDHDLSDRAAEKRIIRKPRFYTGIIGFEFDSRL
jgi:hypothetical protein